VWLAAVVLLGAREAFVSAVGRPPIAIGIAAGTPLIVFFVAFWLSAAFRRFVTSADIRLVAAIEAWRWAGFGFISLYVYGVLPGRFAWPAGLGDMAIGFTAPWIVLALVRRPSFAGSRLFVIWNLLGILDLAAAVSNAALIQSQASGAAGETTVAPMALLRDRPWCGLTGRAEPATRAPSWRHRRNPCWTQGARRHEGLTASR
jgi:hypothetical protein